MTVRQQATKVDIVGPSVASLPQDDNRGALPQDDNRGALPQDDRGERLPAASVCLNCEAELRGPFCARCGQRVVPPDPTIGELVGDTWSELVGWDGKLARTMRALILAPGRLTMEFLRGRRARYLPPLRLFLLCSVAYFLVAAATPEIKPATGKGMTVGSLTISSTDGDEVPAWLQNVVDTFNRDPVAFKRALYDRMPKAQFILLPVFAGLLALVYRKRHFPEHLYFALHLNSFIFLALLVQELPKFAPAALRLPLLAAVGLAITVWITLYTTKAARRVYGGTVGGTIGRLTVVGLLYMLVYAATMVGVLLLVARGI